MTMMKIGKQVLFVTLAISFALFIGYHLTQARSNEQLEPSLDDLATQAVQNQDWDLDGEPDEFDEAYEATLIKLTSALARPAFKEPKEKGDISAYISLGRLYGVDEDGRIILVNPSREFQDAPVLSGDGLKVDIKKKRLAGRGFSEAMQLLKELDDLNPSLQKRISEIQISRNDGLICYFTWSQMIPIVIGQGQIKKKAKSLDIFFDQLIDTGLLDHTRYLDARLGDRIVLKRTS
jgi:hypothetical protein